MTSFTETSDRQRLHDFLMRAPAIICVLRGPDHVFELANEHYLRLVGRTEPEQLVGKPLREALPEIAGQGYLEILDRVRKTGEPFIGREMKVQLARTPGGEMEEVVVNFVYQPTHDATGAADGVLVHAVDVTDQTRAREQVEQLAARLEEERDRAQASERQLRAIVDNTPDCVKVIAPDGSLLDMNASGLAMVDASDFEMVRGKSVFDVIAPEDRGRYREFHARICRGEKGALEYDAIGLQGRRRHLESHGTPLRLADGTLAQLALTRDITDSRAAAEQRRATDERFRAFVTASSDVVYRMSPDWSEMRRLEGKDFISDTEGPNRAWLEKYIHPEDQALVVRTIQEAIRKKGVFQLEHRVFRVDGTLGWTFSRAIPLLNARGEIIEWIGTASDVTERKRAEETVKRLTEQGDQTRRLYNTILSTTPDLVYVFGLDHRFTYANHALLTMWGRTWEDAIGKNCLELGYEPWHAAMHDREIEQVVATRRPIRGEVPFTGTNGRRIYDYIFVPVFGANGEVEAVAGTTRDITERKNKEDALRFLVNLSAATQPLSDPNEIMSVAARMLGEHLGVERCAYAEIEDESIFVITGDYLKGVPSIVGRWPVSAFGQECVRAMLANQSYVVTNVQADPRITPIDLPAYEATNICAVICVPLHKGGKFTAAMAVHQTRSREWTRDEIELVELVVARCWESLERARTVRSLRQSEQRLRFMADSMPQKIFTANAAGEVDYVNPQWLEYSGRGLAEFHQTRWLDLVHPEDREENVQGWRHSIATGEPFQFEHRFRRHDGIYRWHLTRAHALRDRHGQLMMWIGSTTEIDDQKQAEEKLEQMVADRTSKLRETIGELEAFSYSIAHDMRAPLRSLQGFSDVLLAEHSHQLDAEGQGFLRRIATAAGRMDKLIQDVLNYSRLVRGESPLEPVHVDQLLHSIVDTYPMFAPEKAEITVTGAFPVVLGNEAMLTQVFSNLLGNAVKFVRPGLKPAIRVWAEPHGGHVRIYVEDNGIGIAADQHDKIFELFQQANTTFGGTGIGLAIVKKAVERMGGRVGVNSTPGQGSLFWVEVQRA